MPPLKISEEQALEIARNWYRDNGQTPPHLNASLGQTTTGPAHEPLWFVSNTMRPPTTVSISAIDGRVVDVQSFPR